MHIPVIRQRQRQWVPPVLSMKQRPPKHRHFAAPEEQEGPSLLTLFLLMNVAVFVFQNFLAVPRPVGEAPAGFISQEVLREGAWWTVFTHLFVHVSWLHLVVNLALIWLAGRTVLADLGPWHFLYVYLLGGWAGSLLQLFAGASGDTARLVGASGSALALIAAFAALHPYYSITEKLRRFFPIRLKARNLIIGLVVAEVALDIYQRLTPTRSFSPAHLCHVGGAVMGWLYVARLGIRNERTLSAQWNRTPRFRVESFYDDDQPFAHAAKTTRPRRLLGEQEEAEAAPPVAEPVTNQEFIQENVNPILEKLHATGIESLTPQEQEILREAAKRLGE